MNKIYCQIAAIFSLLFGMAYSAHALPPAPVTGAPATGIRVQVYGIHYGGNIIYNYKVINNSNTPFNNFTIGGYFDNEKNFAFPQLTRLPLGWSYGREGETGPAIILAQGSTNQPAYWTSHVYGQEGTANYYLEWRTPWGQSSNAIQPRQTIEGFAVTVPLEDNKLTLPRVTGKPVFTGPDEMYIKGGFKIGYRPSGSNYQEVWGTLERLDTTPPTLTVNDDYDPAPEIQLVSIMANEAVDISDAKDALPGTDDRSFSLAAERDGDNPAGRIYTVTYSATDASGNKATASSTVTVPHDQGK